MSDRELNKYLKKAKKLKLEVSKSKKASRKFLVEMGVLTKNGNPTNRYAHLCTVQDPD